MRAIKLGFISIIAFSILIMLISLLFPSHIRISKAIDINSSRDSILNAVSKIENWKKWYPGADTMELVNSEGQPALRTRNSTQVIRISSVTDSSVNVISTGTGLKKAEGGWNIFSSQTPNTFTVQWYMDIHLGWYPWEKFSGLLLEKRYGPSMEKGLGILKKNVEGAKP